MKRVATGMAVLMVACGPPAPTNDACKALKAGDLVITEVMIDPGGADTGNEWFEVYNASSAVIELKGITAYTKDTSGSGQKNHVIKAGSVPAGGYFTLGDVRSGPNPAWVGYAYGDDLGSFPNSTGVVGVRCGTLALDEFTWTTAGKAERSRMLGGGTVTPSATINDAEASWCDAPKELSYMGANAGTPGAANPSCDVAAVPGQCVGSDGVARPINGAVAGDLLITEVLASANSVSDTVGEWLEVLAPAREVDLNDVVVTTSSGGKSTLTSGTCLTVAQGGYAVLARSVDTAANGGLPATAIRMTVTLANDNTTLSLSRDDAGIDDATFPAARKGVAWQVDPALLSGIPAATVNDVSTAFCAATTPWAGADLGSPGAANPTCGSVVIPDGGQGTDTCTDGTSGLPRAITRPAAGELVITEYMADPSAVSDTDGEWIEVLVKANIDANGLTVGNEGTTTATVTSSACIPVAAGTYLVFAKNANSATNGGLPAVTGTFSFSLGNSGTRAVRVLSQGTELDRVSYTSSTPGASTQLDVTKTDVADNDVAANLCATPTATKYNNGAGDRGTPGLVNVSCL
ncbi:MAG: lamin tail domain-containing protein [Archangium sp.]|nr:lamin tail domain-containing protein [Archangium sp.]